MSCTKLKKILLLIAVILVLPVCVYAAEWDSSFPTTYGKNLKIKISGVPKVIYYQWVRKDSINEQYIRELNEQLKEYNDYIYDLTSEMNSNSKFITDYTTSIDYYKKKEPIFEYFYEKYDENYDKTVSIIDNYNSAVSIKPRMDNAYTEMVIRLAEYENSVSEYQAAENEVRAASEELANANQLVEQCQVNMQNIRTEIDDKRKKISDMETQIRQLKKNLISDTESQNQKIYEQINSLQSQIDSTNHELNDLENTYGRLENDLIGYEGRRDSAQADYDHKNYLLDQAVQKMKRCKDNYDNVKAKYDDYKSRYDAAVQTYTRLVNECNDYFNEYLNRLTQNKVSHPMVIFDDIEQSNDVTGFEITMININDPRNCRDIFNRNRQAVDNSRNANPYLINNLESAIEIYEDYNAPYTSEIEEYNKLIDEINEKINAEKAKNLPDPSRYKTTFNNALIANLTDPGQYILYALVDDVLLTREFSVDEYQLNNNIGEDPNSSEPQTKYSSGGTISLPTGGSVNISDLIKDYDGNLSSLQWTTTNPNVAVVENDKLVIKGPGTTIIVGSGDYYEYSAKIVISKEISSTDSEGKTNSDVVVVPVLDDPTKDLSEDPDVKDAVVDVIPSGKDPDVENKVIGEKPGNVSETEIINVEYKDKDGNPISPTNPISVSTKLPSGWDPTRISAYVLVNSEGNPVYVTDYKQITNPDIKSGDRVVMNTNDSLDISKVFPNSDQYDWSIVSVPSGIATIKDGVITATGGASVVITGTKKSTSTDTSAPDKLELELLISPSYNDGVIKKEGGIIYITSDSDTSTFKKQIVDVNVVGDSVQVITTSGGSYILAQTTKANQSWGEVDHSNSGTTDAPKTGSFLPVFAIIVLISLGLVIKKSKKSKLYRV